MPTKRKSAFAMEGTPAKKSKVNSESLPTAESLIHTKETVELYHSHFFRAQMEELLKNTSISSKQRSEMCTWLTSLRSFLQKLPAVAPVQLSDWSSYCEAGVALPLLGLPLVSGEFRFSAPSSVNFCGSFCSDTIVKQDRVIDICIEMPRPLLNSRDHREGRWLLKRAHYLAQLAKQLQDCEVVKSVRWTRHLGEPLRPTLLVTPSLPGRVARQWQVQLLVVPPEGTFKPHAFAPHKVNIKNDENAGVALLNYVSAVDLELEASNRILTKRLQSNLADGIKLVKIWMHQRDMAKRRGSLSGHVLSMLVAHLLNTGVIQLNISAYHLFRIILQYLGDCNWIVEGTNMLEEFKSNSVLLNSAAEDSGYNTDNVSSNTMISTEDYRLLYDAVLVAPSGYCNLLGGVLSHYLKRLKAEAKHGLELLRADPSNLFELLFIQRTTHNFDQSLHIKVNKKVLCAFYRSPDRKLLLLNQLHPAFVRSCDDAAVNVSEKVKKKKSRKLNSDSNDEELYGEMFPLISEMARLLEKGLGNRVTLLCPVIVATPSWSLADAPPSDTDVTFSLIVDPSHAWSLITKDLEDSPSEFREFWGPRSELRRFRDGTSCETVAWGASEDRVGDCRCIPGRIASFLLHRYFHIAEDSVYHVGPRLEGLLRLPLTAPDAAAYCTGEEHSMLLMQAYDELCKHLRSARLGDQLTPRDMSEAKNSSSHSLLSIVCSEPCISMCEVFPRPVTDPLLPAHTQLQEAAVLEDHAVRVLVVIRHASKLQLPNALENMREELHCLLSRSLKRARIPVLLQEKSHIVAVVVAATATDGQWQTEEELCSEEIVRDTDQTLQLQVDTIVAPKVQSALAGLGRQYSSYAGAVRLCRRWLSSVMLEAHFSPLVVQLLIAQLYTGPSQYLSVPNTPYAAFLRFLWFLSTTNFKLDPVFVNLSEEFHTQDLKILRQIFDEKRDLLPPMVLVTPYDLRGNPPADCERDEDEPAVQPEQMAFRYKLASYWTQKQPDDIILTVVQRIAKQCYDVYGNNILNDRFNVLELCQPNTEMFDMTVKLKREYVPRSEENVLNIYCKPRTLHRTSSNGKDNDSKENRIICKSLVKINGRQKVLRHLQHFFKNDLYIFCDVHGGDTIGVSFVPGSLEDRELQRLSLKVGVELLNANPPFLTRLNPSLLANDLKTTFDKALLSVTLHDRHRE